MFIKLSARIYIFFVHAECYFIQELDIFLHFILLLILLLLLDADSFELIGKK